MNPILEHMLSGGLTGGAVFCVAYFFSFRKKKPLKQASPTVMVKLSEDICKMCDGFELRTTVGACALSLHKLIAFAVEHTKKEDEKEFHEFVEFIMNELSKITKEK